MIYPEKIVYVDFGNTTVQVEKAAKKPYLRESLPEKNLDLMNGIKKVFDPKNILNPHKVAQR